LFGITKRLHHALQGAAGDGTPLGDEQRAIYEEVLNENAEELLRLISSDDVVILHDPQTAGLAPPLIRHGCAVIWRCHIGHDEASPESERGWEFLRPYLKDVHVSIFSRHAYIPGALGAGESVVVAPSIDPFSAKSEPLDEITSRAVLEHTGLLAGPRRQHAIEFVTSEGVLRQVDRRARLITENEPPDWETPLVIQVSRWDPLKDPVGVIESFVRVPDGRETEDAHLMLVGPEITGVADDPEAGAVVEETLLRWNALPERDKRRIHLALLPSADPIENATMVNALQSHARIVVQKSLREGFGLTVTEAMWKARPIVATEVGGIRDQITDHVEGLLVGDPHDLDGVAHAIETLLKDEALAEKLGTAARTRVVNDYLPPRHLLQYAALLDRCLPAA
jgi:trehalose synthase